MLEHKYLRIVIIFLVTALLAGAAGCGSRNAPAPAQEEEQARPPALLDPANWYPGDAHDHSTYSILAYYDEGLAPLAQVVETAFTGDSPLAWLVMTDHGPQLGMRDGNLALYSEEQGRLRFAQEQAEMLSLEAAGQAGCLMMGEELGTLASGHLIALGIDGYVADGPLEDNEQGFINRVGEAGGFCFIAHPRQKEGQLTYWHWPGFEQTIGGITPDSTLRGFELLSGSHIYPEQTGLLETWDRELARGTPVLVTGVSDAHRLGEAGQRARTYIFVDKGGARLEGRDHSAVLEALQQGHAVATTGPLAVAMAVNRRSGESAGPGDTLQVKPGDGIAVYTAGGSGDTGCKKMKLVSDLLGVGLIDDAGATFNLTIPSQAEEGGYYLRLEGYGPNGTCYTNPIFLKESE
jgi:hypothetical protein